MLQDDLGKSPESTIEGVAKKKESSLRFCQAISTIDTLALAILMAHAMTELLGSEHMCFPPSTTLNNPNFEYFDDSEFSRFSLTSLIPEKESFLLETEPVKNTTRRKQVRSQEEVVM